MKKLLTIILVAAFAFAMTACGEKTITSKDLEAAEASLFNDDQTVNEAAAPKVAETFCLYVNQHPDDSAAARYLYTAMEINLFLKDAEKSVEIGNQIVSQYPESEWAPLSLFLLGSYVYNDMLNDTAQAHVAFQRVIDEYPQSDLVEDARKSIEYLGLTPDQILSRIMMSQMEVVEGQWE